MGERVSLAEGGGGVEMNRLIKKCRELLGPTGEWKHSDNDSAILEDLVFTTDSYTVDPLFFPGGNIGDLVFSGTVNDLLMMGAEPLGLAVGMVIEEGFEKDQLFSILETVGRLSKEHGIPIVTGDTKVMPKGKVDGLVATSSGVGRTKRPFDLPLAEGDKLIVSGGIGEHGAALLATRFGMETCLESDSAPLTREVAAVAKSIKQAKDLTRGGLAAAVNELAQRGKVSLELCECPMKKEVKAVTGMLGLDPYSLACEGRMLCVVAEKDAKKVEAALKKLNALASVVGTVTGESPKGEVRLHTRFGSRILPMPSGTIVPRIC